MHKLISLLIFFFLVSFASCQYQQGRGGPQHSDQPPANILLHKQALGQDGSFNYAFAADNGLQQGEVINPDGSRKGSYSYVDPNGKTVMLSYTAGKDGFRVINGDHLPKPPEPQQQRPIPQYHQQPQHSPHPYQQSPNYPLFRPEPIPYEAYRNAPNSPAYRGHGAPVPSQEEAYRQPYNSPYPRPPQFRASPHQEAPYRQPAQTPHNMPPLHYRPRQYSVEEGGYEKSSPYLPEHFRREEPAKPHSFGNGYSFEFAG